MRDRQISVHRIAYEFPILTTTIYEMMSNHLSMKKVSTRWVPNTYLTFSYCCQELLQESEVNSGQLFSSHRNRR